MGHTVAADNNHSSFTDCETFNPKSVQNVQNEPDQSVKVLQDTPGSDYFNPFLPKPVGTGFVEQPNAIPTSWVGQLSLREIITERLNQHCQGYRGLAAFLDSDEAFMCYRRFGFLNSRLILQRQDELLQLENNLKILDQLDELDTSTGHQRDFLDGFNGQNLVSPLVCPRLSRGNEQSVDCINGSKEPIIRKAKVGWHLQAAGRRSYSTTKARRSSKKNTLTLLAAVAALGLPTVAAISTGDMIRDGTRIISGTVAALSGAALIPLQSSTHPVPSQDDQNTMIKGVVVVWIVTAVTYICLQYFHIARRRERYLFATLLLAAHFIVALAQTAKTAIEGILNFGPVVLPVSAYLVSLLFRKRPRARTGHVEDGHDATDHQGPALSTGVSSTNDLRLQHLPPRVEPPIEPSSAAGAEAGEDDIGVQAIGALLSASFGS
ncbi:hypothetical protein MMC12_000965 [Toensbergia leucococca]|nr:hypothetical protein [Toensbergia leucococca]